MINKQEYYYQCVLEYKDGPGFTQLTSWVEEKYAVLGTRMTLEAFPSTIWTVAHVGIRRTRAWVRDRQMAYKRWRPHTDV
jgi:hypothetical protein